MQHTTYMCYIATMAVTNKTKCMDVWTWPAATAACIGLLLLSARQHRLRVCRAQKGIKTGTLSACSISSPSANVANAHTNQPGLFPFSDSIIPLDHRSLASILRTCLDHFSWIRCSAMSQPNVNFSPSARKSSTPAAAAAILIIDRPRSRCPHLCRIRRVI